MNQDFVDLFQELFEKKCKFLIVGAFAVSVHAEPRATGDLDIWIGTDKKNGENVYQALKSFGAPLSDLSAQDLQSRETVFQMGIAPNRIDILTTLTGVDFEQAWKHKIEITIGSFSIPVIGREQLIQNKKALARPKDLFDLELLEKHPKNN